MRKILCNIGTFFTTVLMFWGLLLEEMTEPNCKWKNRKRLITPLHEVEKSDFGSLLFISIGCHFSALFLAFLLVLLLVAFHIWFILSLAALYGICYLAWFSYECAKSNNQDKVD